MKNYIKEGVEYLKDNPEGYWFKRKLYGWGWTPATKEGWLLFGFYLFSILFIVRTTSEVRQLLIEVAIVTLLFLFLVYFKGESPKWQWGNTKADEKYK
jgi:hypothetical protein